MCQVAGTKGGYENETKGFFPIGIILQGKIHLLPPDYGIHLVDPHLAAVCKTPEKEKAVETFCCNGLTEITRSDVLCFHRCWQLKKISICTFPKESSLNYIYFQNVDIPYGIVSARQVLLHHGLSSKTRQNRKASCPTSRIDT